MNREVETFFGKARIIGSEDWTDEQLRVWKKFGADSRKFSEDCRMALESRGWVVQWRRRYVHGRCSHSMMAKHVEHVKDWIEIDEAFEVQERLTPGYRPSEPVPDVDLPRQKFPMYDIVVGPPQPMQHPSSRIFYES